MAKSVAVVGAVVVRGGAVLCAKRGGTGPLAGTWEFPGGKIEPGEAPQHALIREIREELSCEVRVGEPVTTTTHPYEFATVVLSTYWCTLESGEPTASEHEELRWLGASDLWSLEWAPADVPAVRTVQETLSVNVT